MTAVIDRDVRLGLWHAVVRQPQTLRVVASLESVAGRRFSGSGLEHELFPEGACVLEIATDPSGIHRPRFNLYRASVVAPKSDRAPRSRPAPAAIPDTTFAEAVEQGQTQHESEIARRSAVLARSRSLFTSERLNRLKNPAYSALAYASEEAAKEDKKEAAAAKKTKKKPASRKTKTVPVPKDPLLSPSLGNLDEPLSKTQEQLLKLEELEAAARLEKNGPKTTRPLEIAPSDMLDDDEKAIEEIEDEECLGTPKKRRRAPKEDFTYAAGSSSKSKRLNFTDEKEDEGEGEEYSEEHVAVSGGAEDDVEGDGSGDEAVNRSILGAMNRSTGEEASGIQTKRKAAAATKKKKVSKKVPTVAPNVPPPQPKHVLSTPPATKPLPVVVIQPPAEERDSGFKRPPSTKRRKVVDYRTVEFAPL